MRKKPYKNKSVVSIVAVMLSMRRTPAKRFGLPAVSFREIPVNSTRSYQCIRGTKR